MADHDVRLAGSAVGAAMAMRQQGHMGEQGKGQTNVNRGMSEGRHHSVSLLEGRGAATQGIHDDH